MGEALATKYRPKTFEEVCGQESVIKILKRQLELDQLKNVYLFAGPSGTGKTTLAKILADKANGEVIEIDAASNNGVENIRNIIDAAREYSVSKKYKIFILDEVHMLTIQAFNAALKIFEDTPERSIFILCTTDPQKIPATILSRVQRFNLNKITVDKIYSRLDYICKQENFTNYIDTIQYIAKISDGGMRDAISLLDKVSGYSTDLSIENTLKALGNYSYDIFFDLTNAVIDGNEASIIKIIDNLYDAGNDLKIFIDQYLDFVLDMDKYCLFSDMSCLKLPKILEDKVKYTTSIENNSKYFAKLCDKILDIKDKIKYDTAIKTTVEILMLALSRGI